MEKQTELDVGRSKRQSYQPRSRTVVCRTSQQPDGRSLRRQSRGLCFQAEGSRSSYRRSCIARPVEELSRAQTVRLLRFVVISAACVIAPAETGVTSDSQHFLENGI